jgi:predicted secreted protein
MWGLSASIAIAIFDCHDGGSAQVIATSGTDTRPTAVGELSTTAPSDAAPKASTLVHVEDDGKTFDVARGSAITFKLASHGGTGYAWAPSHFDSASLAQQGDRTSELSSDAPGAPKADVFQFTAIAPGETTIEMALRRPFGDATPARILRVTLVVH